MSFKAPFEHSKHGLTIGIPFTRDWFEKVNSEAHHIWHGSLIYICIANSLLEGKTQRCCCGFLKKKLQKATCFSSPPSFGGKSQKSSPCDAVIFFYLRKSLWSGVYLEINLFYRHLHYGNDLECNYKNLMNSL